MAKFEIYICKNCDKWLGLPENLFPELEGETRTKYLEIILRDKPQLIPEVQRELRETTAWWHDWHLKYDPSFKKCPECGEPLWLFTGELPKEISV